ncbi:hypothetical protein GW796_05775 [archaeon]|nr:hypothetical protein [archaeon]NCQ51393.1 hypothetical protein [archaeon]NCT58781.1 hypothetical protein [archaeon]
MKSFKEILAEVKINKKEGIRDYVLIATIDYEKQRKVVQKKLGLTDGDSAFNAAKAWEKELNKKFNYDAEIDIEVKADGESQNKKIDHNARNTVDSYSFSKGK